MELGFGFGGLLAAVVSIMVAIPLVYLLTRLLTATVSNLLGRPMTGRLRLVQVPLWVLIGVLAWVLNFRQFSYGMAATFCLAVAFIWLRNLLRGETWLGPRESRFNSEYFGPAALLFISSMLFWSAVSPFF